MADGGGGPWGGGGSSGGSSGSGGSGGSGSSGGSGGGSGDGGGLGPRNPWSQPPRKRPGGGPGRPNLNAPALDELIRRGRERFGGGFPSAGGKPIWLYALLILLGLWIVTTSFHRVDPAERGVVTRLGSYASTLRPGINFTLPAPIDAVRKVNVDDIRVVDIDSAGERGNLMITGDQNIIDLAYSVRWSIRDPELFIFELAEPADTIREVAESAMREEVARVTLNDAIGPQRSQIEGRVSQRMQAVLDGYQAGVVIQGVAIRQADPPSQVLDAFKEVSAAQQDAQSYLNGARAYAQQITAQSQGEAAAFNKVYGEYRLAPEVTRKRMYYETMEEVLSKVDKTILEAGVTPYLPLGRGAARPVPQPQVEAGR